MKRSILALLALATVLASGCATTNANLAAAPGTRLGSNVDEEYVAQVNEIADRRGVLVLWINPPERSD